MILVGNSRGSAGNLAAHLLSPENEIAQVHSILGFATDDLREALLESECLAKGTRCRAHLYSLSLNPPPRENVEIDVFENAIDRVEKTLGLSGQPRAIIFHEKAGTDGESRRHAHAVWSRIKTDEMKAVQLSWDRKKLVSLSRELFIERGWSIPRGLLNSKERSMTNYTLAEYQQAKRAGKNAREIKEAFQDAWAISDSGPAFTQALAERGYHVARGDKCGFTAVDEQGEVYSIPRQAGVKTKLARERLGDETKLPSIALVKDKIAKDMLPTLERHRRELSVQEKQHAVELKQRKTELIETQKAERLALQKHHETRAAQEAVKRQARFRSGIMGLWDRVRREHKRLTQLNISEAAAAQVRDRKEQNALIFRQVDQRREFNAQRLELKQHYIDQRRDLARDVETYQQMRLAPEPEPQHIQPQAPAPPDDPKQAYIERRQQRPGALRQKWRQAQEQRPASQSGPAPKP